MGLFDIRIKVCITGLSSLTTNISAVTLSIQELIRIFLSTNKICMTQHTSKQMFPVSSKEMLLTMNWNHIMFVMKTFEEGVISNLFLFIIHLYFAYLQSYGKVTCLCYLLSPR